MKNFDNNDPKELSESEDTSISINNSGIDDSDYDDDDYDDDDDDDDDKSESNYRNKRKRKASIPSDDNCVYDDEIDIIKRYNQKKIKIVKKCKPFSRSKGTQKDLVNIVE